jgi:hypothetical protein
MIVPAFAFIKIQKQAKKLHMIQLAMVGAMDYLDGSESSYQFKPTVVEDGNDQDHERREIKLPDQRDQHEPELHIYILPHHHQMSWFSKTNPTEEQKLSLYI